MANDVRDRILDLATMLYEAAEELEHLRNLRDHAWSNTGEQPKRVTYLNTVEMGWRLRKAAISLGVTTVEQLSECTILDFLRLKNVGGTTVLDAADVLAKHGLKLRTPTEGCMGGEERALQRRCDEIFKEATDGTDPE